MLREFNADPAGRRVLVTDGRHATGLAMARALLQAGAASVHVGVADAWRPFVHRAALMACGAELVELDVTDTASVHRLAASLGGKVEILVNTALHLRPQARPDLVAAREEMETAYFGLLRLAQHFGPALRSRAADGDHPACAWVNIIGADALAGSSPAQAAVLAAAQGMRASLRPIRVVNALIGPLDDDWHQALPPPKLSPAALAAAVVAALRAGTEDVAVGDIAQDRLARFNDNPAILAREGRH
jgi:NAD(P)-dependent dehydrogenase (short-subunit alcohol dehydrogenase family)